MRGSCLCVLWALQVLLVAAASQSLPYNPASILLPQISSPNKDIAYAFLPASSADTKQRLVALNISAPIATSNITFETITPDLPFAKDNFAAFIPSISAAGEISVYTGDCATSSSSEIWRFTPTNGSTIGNGTWEKQTINTGSETVSTSMPGADFLSRGFSFSTVVNANSSQTTLYVFGGMCPKPEASVSTWQSAATYSNNMLRLAPSDSDYVLGLPSSRGPPIPEAGFTITGLVPSFSNYSNIMTQQQNFILVGGHTPKAFINMSQVAIWSLPEESWSFVPVDPPSGSNGNTELAVKSAVTDVDSRSGHTAILTEDGSSIIVFGGWVGDINQAAEPQLAILSVGTGFGGEGDWKWSVPNNQPSGSGIYGHGAVMLPGNVMMVLGGYNISTPNAVKRDTAPTTNMMFYNATSGDWTSGYTNPAYIAAIEANKASSSSGPDSKKIGLGVGLGLGLTAIIAALLIFLWYTIRLKKRRDVREKGLSNLSATAANYYSSSDEVTQRGGEFPWANGGWNRGNEDHDAPLYDSNSAVAGYENLQAGVHTLGENKSYPSPPKHVSRKPLHSRGARGAYQHTPTFENHARSNSLGTAGPIHPIYEADEEEQASRNSRDGVGIALGEPKTSKSYRYSDPFKDPPALDVSCAFRDVQTPDSESPAMSREREVQEWVSDWAAADALLNQQARSHSTQGRVSPSRRAQLIQQPGSVSSVSAEEDGRTASNLSDRSFAVSAVTVSRSGSSSQGTRSNSLRGFIANAMNPFGSTILTTAPSTSLGPNSESHKNQAPRSAGSTTSSFTTANTSFHALQVEGEGLLPRPDELLGDQSPARSSPETPGSPSKSKGRGQMGWFGSLKKAFAGETGSGASSPVFQMVPSREPSPDRVDLSGSQPRRTMSASATMWRRKQGKGDWDDSADISEAGTRSGTFTSEHQQSLGMMSGRPDDDEDWDVEQAVQNRVVQVMFTVPKERLRVVNRSVGDDLSDVGSLRSKQGSGKSSRDGPGTGVVGTMGNFGDNVDGRGNQRQEQHRRGGDDFEGDDGEDLGARREGKGRGKVLEMVEMMEGRNTPERR